MQMRTLELQTDSRMVRTCVTHRQKFLPPTAELDWWLRPPPFDSRLELLDDSLSDSGNVSLFLDLEKNFFRPTVKIILKGRKLSKHNHVQFWGFSGF